MRKHVSGDPLNKGQVQRFALDSDGVVMDVRKIQDRDGPFFCPACHDVMIPKRGRIKAWHFSHKINVCAYESYLHSLAKIRIAKWFNESKFVVMDMETSEICVDYQDCVFYDATECAQATRIQYDLKKYYPECEIECSYGGFVADILCPHAKAPLFIEIFVSHECAEEKKQSGQRIIELVVKSEEAIDEIVSTHLIRESESVRLHGFKRKQIPCEGFKRPLTKYTLYQSGKSHVSEDGINCRNYRSRKSSAIYEITAGEDCGAIIMHLVGKSSAHREGYLPKDCSICFWLGGEIGSRICKLHKKCGNPKYCSDNEARKCPMFRVNRELVSECIGMREEWLGGYEIWRSGYGLP